MPLASSGSGTAEKISPVKPQERVILLDVLRAVAILGMFLSNFRGSLPPDIANQYGSGLQGIATASVSILVVGKFWPLFALLMGVGMAVQVERADGRGADIFPVYLRRLLFLYVLGALLSLVLAVGQLVGLAVAGLVTLFIAYPLRRRHVLLLGVIVWMFVGGAATISKRAFGRPAQTAMTAEEIAEFDQGWQERYETEVATAATVRSPFYSVAEIRERAKRRLAGFPRELRTMDSVLQIAKELVPFMLLGVFLWQIGLFNRSWEQRRLFAYLLFFSGSVGLASAWGEGFLFHRGGLVLYGLADPLTPWLQAVQSLCRYLSRPGLDLAYFSLVALLLSMQWPARILKTIAPAGRMAFTNYVLQWLLPPVLFPLLFVWWLPDLAGPAQRILQVTVAFTLLVLFSTWWLRRFHFGPFEWLWRSLTYWKLQPMRVETSSPTT